MRSTKHRSIQLVLIPTALFLLVVSTAATVAGQNKSILPPKPVHPITEFQDKKPRDCDIDNSDLAKRIWFEYGAVYVSNVFLIKPERRPAGCYFINEEAAAKYAEQQVKMDCFSFGNPHTSCLQPEAKAALKKVIDQLGVGRVPRKCNSDDTSTCTKVAGTHFAINDDWALRTYRQTVCNWLYPRKPCPQPTPTLDVSTLRFDTNSREKHQMFSTAMPGASQHHLGLAVDVNDDSQSGTCEKHCEDVMAKHGWYRTVRFDAYHFTFLGFTTRAKILAVGLVPVTCSEPDKHHGRKYVYWVPSAPASYVGFGYVRDHCHPATKRELQTL